MKISKILERITRVKYHAEKEQFVSAFQSIQSIKIRMEMWQIFCNNKTIAARQNWLKMLRWIIYQYSLRLLERGISEGRRAMTGELTFTIYSTIHRVFSKTNLLFLLFLEEFYMSFKRQMIDFGYWPKRLDIWNKWVNIEIEFKNCRR